MVCGIVVEGDSDAKAYAALIRRIRSDEATVVARVTGGIANLKKDFVGYLKEFQWNAKQHIDRALVIRDFDCHDPLSVEKELEGILDGSGFREKRTIDVRLHATKCMLETLLLADEKAIEAVARVRGRNFRSLEAAPDPLEGTERVRNAKVEFQRRLSSVGLAATEEVSGQVAAAADLERIRRRCPNFRRFEELVLARRP